MDLFYSREWGRELPTGPLRLLKSVFHNVLLEQGDLSDSLWSNIGLALFGFDLGQGWDGMGLDLGLALKLVNKNPSYVRC